jgi:hypothetical protein
MRRVLVFGLLVLAFCPLSTFAQSTAAVDSSFCTKDKQTDEVHAFCTAFVAYLNAYSDLKKYYTDNKYDSKGHLDIFSKMPSDIRRDAGWQSEFKGDDTLKAKFDTYADSAQRITPTDDKAIHLVIAALHQKALQEGINSGLTAMAQTMTNTAAANFTSRLDQQTGNGAGTSGTTSLTSLAGSADLIKIAEETGALTQSVNGATTTYSTNAETLFQAITGSSSLGCIVCPFNLKETGLTGLDKFQRYVLSPTNISASYTLQSSTSATATASGQASGTPSSTPIASAAVPSGATTLTGITVKYQILNKFDLKTKAIADKWKAAVPTLAPTATELTKDVNKVFGDLDGVASYKAAKASSPPCADFTAAKDDGGQIVKEFESCWGNAFPPGGFAISKDLATDILTYFKDASVYKDAWTKAVSQAAGNLLTLQYTYNKPPNQPDTHDTTVIFARAFNPQGVLNFNGAVSIYNGALPTGAKYGRIHYGQVSGEFDRNIGSTTTGGLQSQMSLAGYWQYQPEPSVLNIPAGTVVPGTTIPLPNGVQEFVGTKGSLWVTQAKFTLKNSSGVSVPVGVSWSNKTDLLHGSKVGGQVGISYNFQGLSSLFTSKPAAGN